MDAICGILGKNDSIALKAMAAALQHRGDARHVAEGTDYCVAYSSPIGERLCLFDGSPRDISGASLDAKGFYRACASLSRPDELRLRGAFAVAARIGKDWWLTRDRLGVKPLYYARIENGLIFASELKALLASGLVKKRLNLQSIDRYLTLRCVPGPESIIYGARRVQPGHVVVWRNCEAHEVAAFDEFDMTLHETTREDAAERVGELLRDAVEASSSEALLWSAGIDCAALGARRPGAKPVFVSLKTVWQDEAWRARESARLMGLKLATKKARLLTESVFTKVAYFLDEPLADASVFPLWQIAEQSAQFSDTLLSGHGADEMLGGYPRYQFLQKAQGAKGLVPVGVLDEILPALPPNAFMRRGGRYLASIRDNLESYLSLLSVFDAGEREDLYTDAMSSAIADKGGSAEVLRPYFGNDDLTRNQLASWLKIGIPDSLLTKCDRLWAAHGASLEFPYFSDSLVDFAVSLPPKVKFGVRSKPLLRQAMKGVLPGRIRLRARRDFKIPQSGPTVRVIENAARDIITQERVDAVGVFRWPAVEQILRTSTHNWYRRRQFWALLMFFAWHRAFME